MGHYETVCALIEEQQKGKEGTAPWMVGEQLKEIAEREPACAELLAKDLTVSGMGIADAEKKLKAYADKNKNNGFCCITPKVAEGILRKFYGLPEREATTKTEPMIFDLSAFI